MDRIHTDSYSSNDNYEGLGAITTHDVEAGLNKTIHRSKNFSTPVTTSSNELLRTLPRELFSKLQPSLRSVYLSADQYLYMQDDRLDYIYFPETAVIS